MRSHSQRPLSASSLLLFCARVALCVAVLLAAEAATAKKERSLESLIEQSVVKACDRINKRTSPCAAGKRETRAVVLPPAPEKASTESLGRCDSRRTDAPLSLAIQNHQGQSFDVSAVSLQEAEQIFAFVKPQRTRYGLSGAAVADRVCAQRAQIIAYDLLKDCQMKTAKIFVQPSRARLALGLWRNSLHVQTPEANYRWDKFHVANLIHVRQNGRDEPYVIDPLLFSKPVPLRDWEALVKSHDSRASSTITSASTYTLSGASEDDPRRPLQTKQAERDLDEARRQARIMNQR